MRYGSDHKAQTRQRILDAAAVVFRRQGFQGGSVDDVMTEAGLTAGGFYAHFESKEDLFAESLIQTLRNGRIVFGKDDEQLAGAERIRAIARKYLSLGHLRVVDRGCPMPPLIADLARRNAATRRAFQEMMNEIIASLEPHLAGEARPGEKVAPPPDQALAILSILIGGISLARAVADEAMADRILSACRGLVDVSLAHASAEPEKPKPSRRKAAATIRKTVLVRKAAPARKQGKQT